MDGAYTYSLKKIDLMQLMTGNIVNVPSKFRFQDSLFYPEDNYIDFEFWLSKNIRSVDIPDGWTYLPITWTAYYRMCDYGKNELRLKYLQDFLGSLNPNLKYFSCIQWDDGCLNSLSHLDIKVFSMSGQPMDYPLPLICQPHKFHFPTKARKYVVSYVGATTHPVRQEILNSSFFGKPYWYLSHHKHPLSEYCKILWDSTFVLCPRGYGVSSFRIMEALQYGAIPVYISDVHIEPHNIPFGQYGVIMDSSLVPSLPECLSLFSSDKIDQLRENGKRIYENYYTFEANKELILKNLSN